MNLIAYGLMNGNLKNKQKNTKLMEVNYYGTQCRDHVQRKQSGSLAL